MKKATDTSQAKRRRTRVDPFAKVRSEICAIREVPGNPSNEELAEAINALLKALKGD